MGDLDLRVCEECGDEVQRCDMSWTYDCHGVPFRLLCYKCWEVAMENGYDGEHYDESDECLDDDYEGWEE